MLCRLKSKFFLFFVGMLLTCYSLNVFRHMNINLPEIYFTELDVLFSDHALSKLQLITQSIDLDTDASKHNYDEQKSLQDQLKLFYAKLKCFNETIVNTGVSSKKSFKILEYYKWFDDFIHVWFKIMGIEARKGIVRAVKLDEQLNLEGLKHTSSASDTFDLLYVLLIEFKLIVSMEHDKAFMIASEIVSVRLLFCLNNDGLKVYDPKMFHIISGNM